MKKLIISSPRFQGEVSVVYGEQDELLNLDFSAATMEDNQVSVMKNKTPVRYFGITQFIEVYNSKSMRVIEEGYVPNFEEEFWKPYNKKVNKQRVLKIWDNLTKAEQANAIAGLKRYKKHLSLNTWRTKVDPERYLKDKMWLNEWN
jgi:hypothetical protein